MKQKVFISWSGDESRQIAAILRKWLPRFIQSVDPWMSAADIPAGSPWQQQVAKELRDCVFGIICVTPRNSDAPWLLFEAGALSNKLDIPRVCPFLVGVKAHELPGALRQFQAVEADNNGLAHLLQSLNQNLGSDRLADRQLRKATRAFQEGFDAKLSRVRDSIAQESETRFKVIPRPLERTQEIVADLKSLRETLEISRSPVVVRYSGFLSPFAISDKEIDRAIKKAKGDAERVGYFHALREERDQMLKLAEHDRCQIRCIITPPRKGFLPNQVLKHTPIRLEYLKHFLTNVGQDLNIDWAISPFQQKNTYIIGDLSYFEGFKQGAQEGYQFTLRYSAHDEVGINIEMYDELFQRLITKTLSSYQAKEEWDQRKGLRLATLNSVSKALATKKIAGALRKTKWSAKERKKTQGRRKS